MILQKYVPFKLISFVTEYRYLGEYLYNFLQIVLDMYSFFPNS